MKVKQIFTDRIKSHNPICHKQTRFYLIKIDRIEIKQQCLKRSPYSRPSTKITSEYTEQQKKSSTIKQNQYDQPIEYKVIFQVGCRSSQSSLREKIIAKGQKKNKQPQFNKRLHKMLRQQSFDNDIHIFPFEKEEVMTVILDYSLNTTEYGYAVLPLVPFVKMSHTKHQIEVELVIQNDKKQTGRKTAAIIHLSLHFLNNFRGRLMVQPISASLSRNIADIGQMTPLIQMFLREHYFQTDPIDEGGINPHWHTTQSDRYCYFNVPLQSVHDQLFVKLLQVPEVTNDLIVGQYMVDLQAEGFYKNGLELRKFLMDEEREAKMKKQQLKKKEVVEQKSIRGSKIKKDKQIANIDIEILNKSDKLWTLLKQGHNELQSLKRGYLSERVAFHRQKLINYVIKNITTLSSYSPPPILRQFEQKIQQQYNQKQPTIVQKFKQKFAINFFEFTKEQIDEMQKKLAASVSTFEGLKVQRQIRRLLLVELKHLTLEVENKMNEIEIPLSYKLLVGKDILGMKDFQEKEEEVGRLKLNFLFLYQFQFQEEQTDGYLEVEDEKAI